MFDLRKTHVHQKSAFEQEVDRLVQFGGSTVTVLALPLLVSEDKTSMKNFVYKFYRFIQWKFGHHYTENPVDTRLDVNEGIVYTLDLSTFADDVLKSYDTIFLNHCNSFLEDWISVLMCYSHHFLKQPEYWALKVRLPNAQVGWVYPRGLLVRDSGEHPHHYLAHFEFVPIDKTDFEL